MHHDLREELAKVKTLESLANVSKQLRLRCQVTSVFKSPQKRNIMTPHHELLYLPLRRRLPEEIMWIKRAACPSLTGSANPMSDHREWLHFPNVFPFRPRANL